MNKSPTYKHFILLILSTYLLSSCSVPTKPNNSSQPIPLYAGSASEDSLNDFNFALSETKKLFNMTNSNFLFYKYHQPPYRFVNTLDPTVAATTTFIDSYPPYISINNTSALKPTNMIHETMHRISPYLATLLPSGRLYPFQPNSTKALSTYIVGVSNSEKYLTHYGSFTSQPQRYNFFKKRFLENNYLISDNNLKTASANMVASILSDDLLHIDSEYYLKGLNDNYIYSPEELLARALSTYYIMSKAPESSRFKSTGFQNKEIRSQLSRADWETAFPDDKFNSFTAYSIKKEFNPEIEGYPRISPATFASIKTWLSLIPTLIQQ